MDYIERLNGCWLVRQKGSASLLRRAVKKLALNKAVNRQFPEGARQMEIELNLMSDAGSQPTSRSFMETCAGLGIKQAFTA